MIDCGLVPGVTSQWQEITGAGSNGDSAAELWQCPKCHGGLAPRSSETIQCKACDADYPAVDGIPDLRVSGGDTSSYEQSDLESARRYSADLRNASVETVMEQLSDRPEDDDATQVMRLKQILGAPPKFRHQFEGWLKPCVSQDGLLLDVGCGSGGLLAAAATLGIRSAGIDASMTNLVMPEARSHHHREPAQRCDWI